MKLASHHTLQLGDSRIRWRLARSRRRSLAIYVRNGEVEVRSPLQLAERHIAHFVMEKAPWIQARLAQQARQWEEAWRLLPAASIPYLGTPRQIVWRSARRGSVQLEDKHLTISGPGLDEPRANRVFNAWLKQEAERYMTPRIEALATSAGLDHRISAIRFRRTRSKWGHCTASGVLQFNWLVMLAPPPVVDYLIAHEVSHLRHLDHSSSFWMQVEQLCPDHRDLRRWLREHQHRFAVLHQ